MDFTIGDLAIVGSEYACPCSIDSLDRPGLPWYTTFLRRPVSLHPGSDRCVFVVDLLCDDSPCRLLEQCTVDDGKLSHERCQSDDVEVLARCDDGIEAI